MRQLTLTCLALALMGCASAPGDEGAGVAGEVLDVAFVCDRDERMAVRFYPDRELAVLTRHDQQIELPQQPSGSGFIYSNGPNTIRGKGDELTVEIGRMAPIHCKAVP